jgi:hypothetical protein
MFLAQDTMLLGTFLLRNTIRRGIQTLALADVLSGLRVRTCAVGGRFLVDANLLNVLKNKEELPRILRNSFLCEVALVLPALWAHPE